MISVEKYDEVLSKIEISRRKEEQARIIVEQERRAKEQAERKEEQTAEKLIQTIIALFKRQFPIAEIAELTQETEERIMEILKKHKLME